MPAERKDVYMSPIPASSRKVYTKDGTSLSHASSENNKSKMELSLAEIYVLMECGMYIFKS